MEDVNVSHCGESWTHCVSAMAIAASSKKTPLEDTGQLMTSVLEHADVESNKCDETPLPCLCASLCRDGRVVRRVSTRRKYWCPTQQVELFRYHAANPEPRYFFSTMSSPHEAYENFLKWAVTYVTRMPQSLKIVRLYRIPNAHFSSSSIPTELLLNNKAKLHGYMVEEFGVYFVAATADIYQASQLYLSGAVHMISKKEAQKLYKTVEPASSFPMQGYGYSKSAGRLGKGEEALIHNHGSRDVNSESSSDAGLDEVDLIVSSPDAHRRNDDVITDEEEEEEEEHEETGRERAFHSETDVKPPPSKRQYLRL